MLDHEGRHEVSNALDRAEVGAVFATQMRSDTLLESRVGLERLCGEEATNDDLLSQCCCNTFDVSGKACYICAGHRL